VFAESARSICELDSAFELLVPNYHQAADGENDASPSSNAQQQLNVRACTQ
jgi:hypothetical protein